MGQKESLYGQRMETRISVMQDEIVKAIKLRSQRKIA